MSHLYKLSYVSNGPVLKAGAKGPIVNFLEPRADRIGVVSRVYKDSVMADHYPLYCSIQAAYRRTRVGPRQTEAWLEENLGRDGNTSGSYAFLADTVVDLRSRWFEWNGSYHFAEQTDTVAFKLVFG